MIAENLKKSVLNLDRAFDSLREFLAEPIVTRRDRAGVIQAFEYSYEQFWKVFKKIAESENMEALSPRSSIQSAFQLGIIREEYESTWIDIIKTRNETSHTYNEDQALLAVNKICGPFIKAFEDAWTEVQKRIAQGS